MIRTFRARNYGCLVDMKAELTPLHAFIGPNDSGKSTLLKGLQTVVQLASGTFERDASGTWKPFEPFLPERSAQTGNGKRPHDVILECTVDGGSYTIETGQYAHEERILRDGTEPLSVPRSLYDLGVRGHRDSTTQPYTPILNQLASARLVRLDPDALRRPSGLIPETSTVGFIDDRGHGLAGVYFAIRNRDDDSFASLVENVRQHFPTLRALRVKAVTSSEVVLEAELTNGVRVEAKRMSEGLLYYLAFIALLYVTPVSLLLVEEPENGLHPARVAEVMQILRAIVAAGTQVVIATHSPLVVNALQPEEVSVVTRKPEEGTRVKRIKDTPDFEERSKVYALGELWIAYANGEDEAPLLEGREP